MSILTIGVLEIRRNAKIKELGAIGPVLCGSLTTIKVKCGNPECRCAKGEKHTSNILTKKVSGKTKATYVPVEMVDEAKEWTENYRKAKKLLKEISNCNEMILKKYVRTRKIKKKNQAALKKKSPQE